MEVGTALAKQPQSAAPASSLIKPNTLSIVEVGTPLAKLPRSPAPASSLMEPLLTERSVEPLEEDGETIEVNPIDAGEENGDLDDLNANDCMAVKIGQVFRDPDEAFAEYVRFAKKRGYAVRKQRTYHRDWGDKGVYRRDFVCHRAGSGERKGDGEEATGNEKRTRRSIRCNCQAHMYICAIRNGDGYLWEVRGFSDEHTHDLLNQNEVRHLAAYRFISDHFKNRLLTLDKARVPVKEMMTLLENEQDVEVGGLPFNVRDARNFLNAHKTISQKNDPSHLVMICKRLKDKDNEFWYDYQVDEENQLEHIAWSHATSLHGYEHCGDVVLFDTTYKLNAYKMLVGMWVGVTNNGQTCFFGCCLLRNRRMSSFEWAFRVFLKFMRGKAPQTILTDQEPGILEAVRKVMPNTKHALCLWHICRKLPSWLGNRLGTQFKEFKDKFDQLPELETEEKFVVSWQDMIEKYGLSANMHMRSLYELRYMWAKPYLKSYFFAGMRNNSRLEAMYAYIKHIVSSQTLLNKFIAQVGRALEELDHVGEQITADREMDNIDFQTGGPIEEHASKILTPYAFGLFKKEVISSFHYACDSIESGVWVVKHNSLEEGDCKVHHVVGNETISCSCMGFEFNGILCRHAITVLQRNNCFQTPDQYLLRRWCHESLMQLTTVDDVSDGHRERFDSLQVLAAEFVEEYAKTKEHYNVAVELMKISIAKIRHMGCPSSIERNALNDLDMSLVVLAEDQNSFEITDSALGNATDSITKGRSREEMDKCTMECTKKQRICRSPGCGQSGHDKRNCPSQNDAACTQEA
ncbi:protein FAR1-RELATED SEQUENCE 11-like isoform X3 [Telopea speciosissima]|uniref:protein FAR1-RELATED SEQUENCE 11-like isoform X3 n=1 Tax=Telopea speciosissima TaxID=54955 RepID=UPI001CC61CFF|nr:protein FAR1-RELATED SEQUENCE 11-like isoform X3 [Telopea speciosissima]